MVDLAAEWSGLRIIVDGERGQHATECGGCAMWLWPGESAYRIPGLRGLFCSVACAETGLFGQGNCRWCGSGMDGKSYLSIESRLCSEDCKTNYWAHVKGDRSAALGTGNRLLSWLQRERPTAYRAIMAGARPDERHCQNPDCPRGENGQPRSLAHLRAGSRFCSDACRVEVHRSPDRQKSASKTPVFIGFSRNKSDGTGFVVNPPNLEVSRKHSALDAESVRVEGARP